MARSKKPSQPSQPLPISQPQPGLALAEPMFRSAAVARMARMPVSTLRVWEQRNQAARPTTAPSGHRRYGAADVQRVVILRQLTERGHAIGSLAGLNFAQLQDVALAHEHHAAQPKAHPTAHPTAQLRQPAVPLRVVVVGQAMAQRLQRYAAAHNLPRPVQVVAVFESLAQSANGVNPVGVDLLLWQSAGLQDNDLQALEAAQTALQARAVAVAYRFAGTAARNALMGAGFFVAREPADDDALWDWLGTLAAALFVQAHESSKSANATPASAAWPELHDVAAGAVAARLFDDATLTEFAHLPSTVACECPAHLAQLLMQISSFETYSAQCTDRNPADAALHTYLHRVAASARTLFEAALQRVAAAEGLALSPSL